VRFSAPVQTGCEAHTAPYTMRTGVKLKGRDVEYPPPYSAELKEIAELRVYLCSFSGSSWPVIG
jgi:hypothetical protein